jgi:single-stranded DNA-binding protein
MNYVGGIVRILETPKLDLINNTINRTEFHVQVTQIRKKQALTIIKLVFWGDFAYDVANYYRINDYILVEGYLAFKKKELDNVSSKTLKNLEITVFKVYPLFLNSERKSNNIEELK